MAGNTSEDIVRTILFDPIRNDANRLCAISSHATPSMVSWLIETYEENGISDISIKLIVASVLDDGIYSSSHEGLRELHSKNYPEFNGTFSCSYLYQPPTSTKNLYIWLDCERPIQAFSCSYDFTQTSLLKRHSGPITNRATSYAYKLYEQAVNRSIYCSHSEVEDYITVRSSSFNPEKDVTENSGNKVVLSLLTRAGEPGKKSGLNWGQRNKRNRNKTCIPLPSKIAGVIFSFRKATLPRRN